MKANFYIGILSALILAVSPVKAQFADNRDFSSGEAGVVINNYYGDYDYYYSSRINRFHRSYAAFDYYSPVYTDTYWYSYQPYSWGLSIYGRSGLRFGYAVNYPVYYYGWGYGNWYNYDYGWYDPYYGSSWYWGYDPYYYSWYSPVVINLNFGYRWGHNYWSWNRHSYWDWNRHDYWYNDYRPHYNTYHNNYNYSSHRYSSRELNDRGIYPENSRTNTGNYSRRENIPGPSSRNEVNRNYERVNTNNANSNGEMRRNTNTSRNNSNNGNNNNSRPDGNNGNFGNKGNNNIGTRTPATVPTNRRMYQTSPSRTQDNNNQGIRSRTAAGNPSGSQVNANRSNIVSRSSQTSAVKSTGKTYSAPVRSSSPSRGATVSQSRNSSPSRSSTVSQGRTSSRTQSKSSGTPSKSSSSRSSDSSSRDRGRR